MGVTYAMQVLCGPLARATRTACALLERPFRHVKRTVGPCGTDAEHPVHAPSSVPLMTYAAPAASRA